MGVYAFAAPIARGKLDAWKQFCAETSGPRRAERMESMRRCGITRERVFLQQTPNADLAIVYLEGEDPQQELHKLLASTHPFDKWLADQIIDTHGIDVTQPPPPSNELVVDVSAT
jgi:hypothetical protein